MSALVSNERRLGGRTSLAQLLANSMDDEDEICVTNGLNVFLFRFGWEIIISSHDFNASLSLLHDSLEDMLISKQSLNDRNRRNKPCFRCINEEYLTALRVFTDLPPQFVYCFLTKA